MKAVRWVLVGPLWVAGLFAWIFATVWIGAFVRSLCPEDLVASGTCAASWYVGLKELAFCASAAAGAIAMVALPSLAAPRSVTLDVAVSAYGLGGAVAICVTWAAWMAGAGMAAILPLLVALAAGLITVSLFARRRSAV